MKLVKNLLQLLASRAPQVAPSEEPEEPQQLILPNFWGAPANYPVVEKQLETIAQQVDGVLFKIRNQFSETKLAVLMSPGYLLVIGPEELGAFLTANYILIAGDGTGRQLPGADFDFWQRLYRYLTSDRSKLGPPPIKLPLYSPEPAEQEWDTAWYKGTGLSRLFSLDPC